VNANSRGRPGTASIAVTSCPPEVWGLPPPNVTEQ
jgi:hypothetical protein